MTIWSQITIQGLNYVRWMETQTISLYIIAHCSQYQLFSLHNGTTNVWRQSIVPRTQHIKVFQYNFCWVLSAAVARKGTETYSSQLISLIMQEKKYSDIKIMSYDWELWCFWKVPMVFLKSSTFAADMLPLGWRLAQRILLLGYTVLRSPWELPEGFMKLLFRGVMIPLMDNHLCSFLATVEAMHPVEQSTVLSLHRLQINR